MKKLTLLLLFIFMLNTLDATSNSSNTDDKWRVYVTTFQTDIELDKVLIENISDNFQYVLQSCNERFTVKDRRYFTSWIEEASAAAVDESKTLLNFQDLEYIVFGEVIYNSARGLYSIEYGFEEVNTGQILLVDNIFFKTMTELTDETLRYNRISERFIKDFDLCQPDAKKAKAKTTTVRGAVRHELRDTDGDGVPNIIDEELNTPPGALVNSKGVAFTKEELEKAKAQIRTDSATDEMTALLRQMMPALPTVSFLPKTNRVEEESYTQLHQVAKVMEMYPAMRVIVIGNTNGIPEPLAYQRSYNTITYLLDHYELPEHRFILAYVELDNEPKNTVAFEVTMDEAMRDMPEPR